MTPNIETLIERLEDPERYVDAIDDAIDALRAVQWRPISEAPKDKPVLGKFSETHIEGIEWAGDEDGYWRFLSDGDQTRPEKQPIEFMPLPAARALKEG